MTKHTPGPWQRFDNGGVFAPGRAYGPQFADVVWGPDGPGHGVVADCSPHSMPATPETIANARLIAVTPVAIAFLRDLDAANPVMSLKLHSRLTEILAAIDAPIPAANEES